MTQVFFEPWVGKDYVSGGIFGKRILVLGESHYGNGEPTSDTTLKVIGEYLDSPESVPPYLQTFKVFERSLTGKETDRQQRQAIWDSLLFYNFVQEISTEAPRQKLDAKNLQKSVAAFFEVLDKYRPEYIIVWGYRLWDNYMPSKRWEWSEPFTVDGKNYNVGAYILADGMRVKAFPVKHPSGCYSWEEWHKVLRAFIPFAEMPAESTVQLESAEPIAPAIQAVVAAQPEPADSHTDEPAVGDVPHIERDETVDKIIEPAVYNDLFALIYSEDCKAIIDKPYSVDMNAKELLPQIRKALCKADHDWEYAKESRRTLKILDKIAKSVSVEHGQVLANFYLNTYCLRGKDIQTTVLNEPYEHTFSDAPENFDYDYDFAPSDNLDNLTKYVAYQNLLCKGVEGICSFSVENKERSKEPYILCPSCKGAGRKKKCSKCKGTGRVQYVDGYFASGEERIKTGICTTCSGTGKTECSECNGQGKIEIYAPIYTVVKSVKEKTSQVAGLSYATPWDSDFSCDCYIYNEKDEINSSGYINASIEIQKALYRDEYLRIRMQNRMKAAVDNRPQLVNAMKAAGVSALYKKCEESAKNWFDDRGRGALVSQHTRHYLIPVSRLTVKLSENIEANIYLLPFNDKKTIAILKDTYRLEDTGLLKYLYYKLFK